MSESTIRDFAEIADSMLEAARKAAKGLPVDFDTLPEIRGNRTLKRVTKECIDDRKMTDLEGLVLHAIWLGIGQGIEIHKEETDALLEIVCELRALKRKTSDIRA